MYGIGSIAIIFQGTSNSCAFKCIRRRSKSSVRLVEDKKFFEVRRVQVIQTFKSNYLFHREPMKLLQYLSNVLMKCCLL